MRTEKGKRLWWVATAVLMVWLGPVLPCLASAGAPRPLTFEQRVAAEQAIESVRYRHLVGAALPFDVAVPRTTLENNVRGALRRSEALRTLWSRPITDAMLEAELARIIRHTRFPDRLGEIHASLDHDIFLLKETFVRSVLADRLSRAAFAYDRRIHAGTMQRAELFRAQIGKIGGLSFADAPRPRIVERVVSGVQGLAPPGRAVVRELRDSFSVERARGPANAQGRVTFEIYDFPKRSWDGWWREVEASFPIEAVPVASESSALAVPSPANGSVGCGSDDVWQPGALEDSPDPRYGHRAVWTGREMIVWGGVGPEAGQRYDPLTDTWSALPAPGAPGSLRGSSAVWTGQEMIVWGGALPLSGGGAAYDPAAGTWRTIRADGAPAPRAFHSAVWTGREMIVWGGAGAGVLDSGGRYDPASDTWQPMSALGAPSARVHPSAIWTGLEVIVWGGSSADCADTSPTSCAALQTGGRYDPASDSWSAVTALTAPAGRVAHSAVWTGQEMIVWGGHDGTTSLADGAGYDPARDDWRPISSSPFWAVLPRYGHTAVWTGARMIVWGGVDVGIDGAPEYPSLMTAYDPAADSWLVDPFSRGGGASAHAAVWTGSEMIVWGGLRFFEGVNAGGRYAPDSGHWADVSTGSAPSPTGWHTAVWTGSEMIVWGGADPDRETEHIEATSRGGVYDPVADAWRPTALGGAPTARQDHSAVWSGTEMIIWGGRDCFASFCNNPSDGGRYDPLSDEWKPVALSGSPDPRSHHVAVWSGREMLIWGGQADDGFSGPEPLGNGARYDPVGNLWSPIAGQGAPEARSGAAAIWSGAELILWGGRTPTGATATGGRYTPGTDTWRPTPITGAPEARAGHAAVWTGTRMVLWGGQDDSGSFPESSGLYDPAADAWLPAATYADRQGGMQNSFIWTGREVIAWGGFSEGTGVLNLGARYDPLLNLWTAMTTQGAPSSRSAHAAVWADGQMIVWGGEGAAGQSLSSGGMYLAGPSAQDLDGDGFAACDGDCDDSDPVAHPGGAELPGNRADENCDGALACDPDAAYPRRGAYLRCVSQVCRELAFEGLLRRGECRAQAVKLPKNGKGAGKP